MTAPTATRPSLKQLSTIASLCVERGTTAQDLADELFGAGFDLNDLTGGRQGTASQMISALFGMPRVDGQGTTPPGFTVEPGTYRVGDETVRVVISRAGEWYAKRAVQTFDAVGRESVDWQYIGRRIDLSTAQRIEEEK